MDAPSLFENIRANFLARAELHREHTGDHSLARDLDTGKMVPAFDTHEEFQFVALFEHLAKTLDSISDATRSKLLRIWSNEPFAAECFDLDMQNLSAYPPHKPKDAEHFFERFFERFPES